MIGTQRRPSERKGISFEKWTPEVTEFQPHPFSIEVYGEPTVEQIAEMKKSILDNGLITPILVWNKHVISGTTRWTAMKQLHGEFPDRKDFQYIPTTTFDGTDIEVEQKIIEANRQRVKTESQKDAEAAALLRIETELARQRQREGVRQNLAEGGKAVEKVAAITGESSETVRKRVAIHAAGIPADERDKLSTHAAHENLPKPTSCDICQAPFESKGAMSKHRRKAHDEEMAKRRTEVVAERLTPDETQVFNIFIAIERAQQDVPKNHKRERIEEALAYVAQYVLGGESLSAIEPQKAEGNWILTGRKRGAA